ncbi:U4/U6-associated splicing factor PRP4 [Ostreococcus tauri]|uniref:U4/U6-associated splicing factor PRP4 n=1 Tax=Ostreococcus tauri TaxID=70448 RepID=A0A1Y5IAV1_OSTTA|nr:U4/U6-associated splicing factor PRP4 [Ostreococcus tauri]
MSSDASSIGRVLSIPSTPRSNNGRDNANDDLILREGEELGERVGSASPTSGSTKAVRNGGKGVVHPRDDEDVSESSSSGATYTVVDTLGSGTFGQVVSVSSSVDGSTLALKVIKNHPAYFHQAHVEIGILRTLNMTCGDRPAGSVIVELADYFICHNHLCLVFELLGMNLYELLRKNKFKGLHLGAIRGIMKQLLSALDVLRDAHVVHCDIKPENILLVRDNSFQVKLVDFGSACFQNRTVYQYIQSRFYRSPEVFLGMPYGMPIDMWSLGCVAAELFLGLPIFPGSSEYDLLCRICETMGTPPTEMLAKAPNTNKFFTRVDIGFGESSSSLASSSESGTSKYKLLSLRDFEARTGRRAAMGKKYFKYTELADIIASIPYQSSKVDPNDAGAIAAEKKARVNERSAFYDLLVGMMEIDPATRWTPAQALKHPFVTGDAFEGPFTPPKILERTTPEEREEIQRLAAKEAAKVSSGEPLKKKKKPQPVEPPEGIVPPTPPAVQPTLLRRSTTPCCKRKLRRTRTRRRRSPPSACPRAECPCPRAVASAEDTRRSSSFIGSPHAMNSAAMHPLHFGMSPPTQQLSNMGLSTSHQVRAAQAAAAVHLPSASPLGKRGTTLARGMAPNAQAMPATSYSGAPSGFGWSPLASASASRENLKTLQPVPESQSPPMASPSPDGEVTEEDRAEGADWDPTFDDALDDEATDENNSEERADDEANPVPARAFPVKAKQILPPQFAVGSAPTFVASGFGVSPNSAFGNNKTVRKRNAGKDAAT